VVGVDLVEGDAELLALQEVREELVLGDVAVVSKSVARRHA